jgi:catechol 2,3-dioxygenase-like lactoylglutathione lyase family enzyme
MASRITELVLDCADPERLAGFWTEVLGYEVLDRQEELVEIGLRGGGQPTIVFLRSGNPRGGKLPLHIDINATDRDQAEELERLLALGARPVDIGQTGQESWHVLQDPEGNEFCLLRTRVQPLT